MSKQKREIDVLILSDTHLGTYGCHATELLHYLKSVKPRKVILNGDIIDIWQFNKRYFPASHMLVIKHLLGWVAKGVKVYYVTGNHDEMLRKFVGFKMGSLKIVNKLVMNHDGKRSWIFHGDVFDVTMQHSKWLARLGAVGYDMLIIINRIVNYIAKKMGRGKLSLSKRIKNSVKSAVKFINSFEQTAADIGISNGYDFVICGHIHQPEIRDIETGEGKITYMNSGDWIENLSSLEYHQGTWQIYRYHEDNFASKEHIHVSYKQSMNTKVLFANLVNEFTQMKSS
jgi:UDP-2,3-diacylglucosamine pyrophosphatase LpxH